MVDYLFASLQETSLIILYLLMKIFREILKPLKWVAMSLKHVRDHIMEYFSSPSSHSTLWFRVSSTMHGLGDVHDCLQP